MVSPNFSRVKGNDPIATKTGTATPAFIRFWDQFCRGLESLFTQQAATDARQDAVDVAIQGLLNTIVGILNGTIPFSELNVASTQYRAFLQKTDGTKLVNSTGLDGSVVLTSALNSGAANQMISVFSLGGIALAAGVATVVQTIVATTVAGETVDLTGQFSNLEVGSATGRPSISAFWKRNSTSLQPASATSGIDVTRAADPARYVLGAGQTSVVALDTPGAGTHTFTLVVSASVATGIVNPYGRLLTATRP